ncbi:MAG: YbjN domain-containing protein [Caulobacteraceae bacterium]|nr:YbjN domain-containing protein [Caulobacteraceae bacterium]
MNRMILALVISGLAVTSAKADAPLVRQWDATVMTRVLQSLGSTDIKTGDFNGRPAITARTRDGLNVGLYAKGCDPAVDATPPVCHGLEGVISYDASQKPNRAVLVDQLNHDYALGKFMAESDGMIRASRYFLLDGGVSEENLRSELNGYFAVGALAARTLWPEPAAR